MNASFLSLLASDPEIGILRGEPLFRHTTFRIGGKADVAVFPETPLAFARAVDACRRFSVPYRVIGKGSNVLFDDSGYAGAVLFTDKLIGISVDGNRITCGAGIPLKLLCHVARDNGLAGLAFAYGIPGTVGGAVYMNAGAFEGQMSDVFYEASYYDPESGEIRTVTKDGMHFGYRHSLFMENGGILLSATFLCEKGDPAEIDEEMMDHIRSRAEKQPLAEPSAGSVFRRPAGHFAGALIAEAGLSGRAIGGAKVSEKHAGFIVNTGSATAADVRGLIRVIQNEVMEKSGILLEPEIVIIDNPDRKGE
ncbi:MAG: UDP-N-acetylmuramate dehydrogenase [Ruminococcus sp.]|nr:UDP-N-acetylmuramate dehydrogenase [Candidatus Apopatosoma intestinale]